MVGKLKFIALGPMFSGKSTFLIHEINRAMFANLVCVIIKYTGDTRYDEYQIISHDFIKPNMLPGGRSFVHKCATLTDDIKLNGYLKDVDVVAIDEAQFFPDIFEFVRDLLYKHNKTVFIASLDSWHNSDPCLPVIRLVPYAERVKKLMAVCGDCKRDNATRTYKSVIEQDTSLIQIGGSSMYSALCESCYSNRMNVY